MKQSYDGWSMFLLCASFICFKHQGWICCCRENDDVNEILNNGEICWYFRVVGQVNTSLHSQYFNDVWLSRNKHISIIQLDHNAGEQVLPKNGYVQQREICVYQHKEEQYAFITDANNHIVAGPPKDKTWAIVSIKAARDTPPNIYYISDISSIRIKGKPLASVGAFENVDFNMIQFVAANTKNVKNLGGLFWNQDPKPKEYNYQIRDPKILCVENCMYFERIFCFNSERLPKIDKEEIKRYWKINKNADILWFYSDNKYALPPKR